MANFPKINDLKNPNCLDPIRSLYIHVPFCTRKCGYCDYYSIACRLADFDAYYQGIVNELELTLAELAANHLYPEKLKTLYFGGGTPSILPPPVIEKIITLIRKKIGFSRDIEITLEVNPEAIGRKTVVAAIEQGVNRISLGFQAKQDTLLEKIGRLHKHQDFLATLDLIRQQRLENISCDLMFGLPTQTLDNVLKSAAELICLEIPHISFYSLILEERTLFYKRYANHPELLPDEDLERKMYRKLLALFEANGYQYYELSSTAKPGFRSRHNSVYWTTEPYLGLGPSAHSYYHGNRKGNVRSLKRWLEDPMQSAAIENIDFELSAREYAMLAFRTADGFSIERFEQRYKIKNPFEEELQRLQKKNLIYFEPDRSVYLLTNTGLDFANQVFMEFL